MMKIIYYLSEMAALKKARGWRLRVSRNSQKIEENSSYGSKVHDYIYVRDMMLKDRTLLSNCDYL